MEGVDHVHVVEVGCRSFVGDIHGMFQWKIPHWESLELGISRTDASLVLIVELRETSGHLAAAWTRSGNNDKWAVGLYVVVLAKTFVAGYELYIVRIAVNGVVDVRLDAFALEPVAELIGSVLTIIVSDHHTAHHEVATHEFIAQAEHVLVVGDAEIGTNLVLLNIFRAHHNDNLYTVAKLCQHT